MPEMISSGVALFLAWLMAMAASHKLRAPDYYRDLLEAYVPGQLVGRTAVWGIAMAELLLAAALLVPATREIGLLASAAALLAYAGLMAWQIKRGIEDLACGCAGPASTLSVSPALVLRNGLCAALAFIVLVSPVSTASGLAAHSITVGVAGFLILLYLCSDQLIANAQQMAGEF